MERVLTARQGWGWLPYSMIMNYDYDYTMIMCSDYDYEYSQKWVIMNMIIMLW